MVRKFLLYMIAFVSGAVVLALEIVAGRFLQPTFGNTIEVWGNLIAVFLAGLSLGYYVGGHVADRLSNFFAFGVFLFVAAALLATLPLYNAEMRDFVFGRIELERVATIGSLWTSLALFLAPTTVLGMVSPYAVRLLADDPAKLGRQVGSLYALSTLGSIVGALGTTFFLVVQYTSSQMFVLFGAVEAALGLIAIGYGLFAPAREQEAPLK